MATRRERVLLELDDQFTGGIARAAVATGALDRALNDLDGSGRRSAKGLDESGKGAERLGASSGKAGPEVDRLSGRLRLLADTAVTLGPALVPLGAATVPVLTSALAGLGAAAGGISAAVLAFNGLGDAMKAIDAAHAEPTAQNLMAMRVELEKLGPAGAEFAQYLDRLRPAIDDLQNTARSGMFPGLEDGIDALLTRGPEVTKIINRLSQGMGDLARDAGQSLASDDWDAFFRYVETDARPTLEAFGHATGNVALGVANMLAAFAPLSRDFTGGLEDATKAFADWSAGLDSNESFQNFMEYIRDSGPQVVDFLGALVSALSGLLQAAAPLGQVVLPALTGIAKAFAAIASSPIGPGLYTAAAALIAFNRASVIAEKSSTRFSAAWAGMSRGRMAQGGIAGLALLASSLSDVDDKAHLANTTLGASAGLLAGGPWGLAIGAAVGQALDLKDAYTETADAIEAANDAMRENDLAGMRDSLQGLQDQLDREHPKNGTLANYMDAVIGSFHDFTGQTAEMEFAVGSIQDSMKQGGDVADLFGETIGQTGNQMRVAAGDAQALSGALAQLNGWFDKRAAVRGYKDAIDELRKSLKDGFTREDAANLDAVGTSILQVAAAMKSDKKRGEFLQGARASLNDIAKSGGPKAKAAVAEVVAKFDELGLTHAEPKITADDKRAKRSVAEVKGDLDIMGRSTTEPTIAANDNPFRQTYGTVKAALREADQARANPKVTVDPGNSLGILGSIARMLGSLHDRTVTVRTNHIGGGSVTSSAGGHSNAAPGDAPPRRAPRIGRTAGLSGRASAGDFGAILGGGLDVYTSRGTAEAKAAMAVSDLGYAAGYAARGVNGLNKQLEEQRAVLDAAKQSRDAAIGRRDSISSGIQQGLGGDIWAGSSGSPWAAGAFGAGSPQGAMAALQAQKARAQRLVAAINTLKSKGITGPVLLEIIGTGDVERAEAMASLDVGTLGSFSSVYGETQGALAAAGLAGGNAIEGGNIAALTKAAEAELKELRNIVQAIKSHDDHNTKGQQAQAAHFVLGVNGAAGNGHRRGRR